MSGFQIAIQDMKKRRKKAAENIAVFLETESKMRAPVKTGHLRRNITHDTKHNNNFSEAIVGVSNVEYAPVIEFGSVSRNILAQPYLRPSINENLSQINEIIKRGMSDD